MQDLPVEVWRLVFDGLSRSDLCSLCLTSQQLQALGQPQLFSNIEYNWVSPESEEDLAWDLDLEPPLRVASLVRALHRRPDLAEAVRSVSLLCSRPSSNQDPVKIEADEDDFKDLAQAAGLLELPFATVLSQTVSDGVVDGFVTLLLALTPGITHLKLRTEFASNTKMLSQLILYTYNHPESNTSSLKHLSHVEYISWHLKYQDGLVINTDDITPFFYLPAMQKVTADMQDPCTFAWPLPAPPAMANLTHLRLTRVREKTLAALLEHTKSLQSLDWRWVYDDEYFGYLNEPVIDLDGICEALAHVRSTLTTLRLRGAENSPGASRELELKGSMRGLEQMTEVTTFETTLQFFMGFEEKDYTVPLHECLPPSVKTVCFNDNFDGHTSLEWTTQDEMEVIETWWKVKSEKTPDLQEFELRYEGFDERWRANEREELAEMGKAYGVMVKVYEMEGKYDYTPRAYKFPMNRAWRLIE